MNEQRLKSLFDKYMANVLSDEEREEFLLLAAEPGAAALLRSYMEEYDLPGDAWVELPYENAQRILDSVLQKETNNAQDVIQPPKSIFNVRMMRFAAAAVLLLCAVGGYKLFVQKENIIRQTVSGNDIIKDADPGHNGAVLTLSNGQSFTLDTAGNGTLAKGITKSANLLSVAGGSNTAYATLVTPLGRQQQLKLSDGTIAWLNAGSSIRFPTVFAGNQRIVEITGEVYFEVVHNSKQPFIVKAGKEEIRDIGTHFDVNAYSDEPTVKTTLVEGSVQIGKCVLKPGEQYANGNVTKVDADGAVAWVSGYFHFDHADIHTVMKQLARWYNVQVQYEGNIPSEVFGGDMQRSLKLSQVLDVLTGTEIHYTLDGNKLTIHS